MARQIVSEEELRNWMDAEIKKHDVCADCHFGGIMELQGTDATGCNWSEPMLSCSGQPTAICVPVARRVIAEARKRFNLG